MTLRLRLKGWQAVGRPSNPAKIQTLTLLRQAGKKSGRRVWHDMSKRLESHKSQMSNVNVSKVSTLTKEGDVILVPGKVLGSGIIDHKIHIGAFSFSGVAIEKIRRADGEPLSVQAFIEKYINHKGLIILG